MVLACILFACSGVRIAGRSEQYLDDYNEYYLLKKEYTPIVNFDMGTRVDNGYYVWFLPGQKRELLKKIEEEVHAELTDLVANNSDLLESYEIRDDFRKIYLYFHKGKREESGTRLGESAIRIETKVELYHQFIHGFPNTSFKGSTINSVEVE